MKSDFTEHKSAHTVAVIKLYLSIQSQPFCEVYTRFFFCFISDESISTENEILG